MNNYQPRAPHPGRPAVKPQQHDVQATSCNTQLTPGEGHGVGQGCQLGQQGEQLLVLVATYEPGRGEQHGRGAQALAGARRRGNAAPQLPSGPVVLARGVGQRPAAATLDDPAGGSQEVRGGPGRIGSAACGSVLALAWSCSVARAAAAVACSQMRVRSPGVTGCRSSPMVLPRPPAAAGAHVVPADRLDYAAREPSPAVSAASCVVATSQRRRSLGSVRSAASRPPP